MEDGQLHLVAPDERRALQLLPFVKVMLSPRTAQNACYFYNRSLREGLRFVSYHFETEADIVQDFEDTAEAIHLLELTSAGEP